MKTKRKLPKTWEEYSLNTFTSQDETNVLTIFSKLLQLRDCYRNGWKPDWSNALEIKQCIRYSILAEEFEPCTYAATPEIFSFQDTKTRDEFFKNFGDMLNQLKYLY